MEKQSMFKIVKELEFDKNKVVFKKGDIEIFIFRPSELSARFKGYDPKKNFQIWLRDGTREFRPNHLRVMIDINLRVRSRPDLKEKLLKAFDNIYYGEDPEKELIELEKEKVEHYLNPIMIIGVLAQLFHIEQEYGYHRESKFEPPNLFLQGWIREFIDSPKEIDNLCMSVAAGQPPKAQYVKLENKKDKKHAPNLKPLWYLQNS
jgi:hypothetical protein